MFLKTKVEGLSIVQYKDGKRAEQVVYPVGAVVEVDESRAKDLIEGGYASLHPGPASMPKPEEARQRQPERATSR